jgi:hypothetical protein
MRAAKLSSSLISRIGYDAEEKLLKVWLRDGPLYCYFDVPERIFEAFRDAQSPGRFYNAQVKSCFRCSFDPERRRFRPAA